MNAAEPDTLTRTHRLFEIEKETVGQIPENERHGTGRGLTAIWAGMNMTPLTVVTGATVTVVLKLPLGWAIAAILIGVVVSFAIAFFGYRFARFTTALSTYIVGALIVICVFAIAFGGDFTARVIDHGAFTIAGFSSMVAIGIAWQLTYAPYVSDYSRYMPKESGARGAFWGTYAGCVSSSVVLMILGAIVGLVSSDANTMTGLDPLLPRVLGYLVLLGFALAAWTGNAVTVYCSTLCTTTLVETFVRDWHQHI